MIEDSSDVDIRDKAISASIIEHFSIEGLFGYRNIGLSSPYAATVLIAQNGAGKTTLMSALNAILCGNFGRLRHLRFNRIAIKFRDRPVSYISHLSLRELDHLQNSQLLAQYGSELGVDGAAFFAFLIDEFGDLNEDDYSDHPLVAKMFPRIGYNEKRLKKRLLEIRRDIYNHIHELHQLDDQLISIDEKYDIVYLPTYRRLELTLANDPGRLRRRRKPRLKFDEQTIHSGKVEFGLSDIREQLNQLNNEISLRSNTGYRDLTARIINDLLANKLDDQLDISPRLPTEDELDIFFERLSDNRRRIGPFQQVKIPDISKLHSSTVDGTRSNFFLRYFMDQLTDVIAATKDIERSVDDFVNTCNRYLSRNDEISSNPHAILDGTPIDAKELKLNKSTLSVTVESTLTNKRIDLDWLSSGEKQMISLFARMYLYPKPKIVLIDEPELSLSIDWQTQVLPDILNSPNCHQLIAITHSPFVFENVLEPQARSLEVSVDLGQLNEISDEGDASDFVDLD